MNCDHDHSSYSHAHPVVAHLSCKTLTVQGNFCRRCGKALTTDNTIFMDNELLPEEWLTAIFEDSCVWGYKNLDDIMKFRQL